MIPAPEVRLLAVSTTRASERVAEMLAIKPGDRVVYLRRQVLQGERPSMYHVEYVLFDARRPLVESQLQSTSLHGLLQAGRGRRFPRGKVTLRALRLTAEPHGCSMNPPTHRPFVSNISSTTQTVVPSAGVGSCFVPTYSNSKHDWGPSESQGEVKSLEMLETLGTSLIELDEEQTLQLTREILNNGEATPITIINACQQAMRVVGERYERQEYYLSGTLYLPGSSSKKSWTWSLT